MAVMTDSTCRHAEFKLATNTALSDFPVEAKSEEQRNCLKHVVGRIDVLAISHRLALEKFEQNRSSGGNDGRRCG